MSTTQNVLNNGFSSHFLDAIAYLRNSPNGSSEGPDNTGFGSWLRFAMVPTWLTRTGLASGTTHTEAAPGLIHAVTDEGFTTELTIKHIGAPGAGEVLVTYDSNTGVPTLEFNGAVTGYQVLKVEAPPGVAAKFAADV